MFGKRKKWIADLELMNSQLSVRYSILEKRLASANDDRIALKLQLGVEVARSRSLQRLVVLYTCPGERFCDNVALFSLELVQRMKEESHVDDRSD